MELMWIIYFVEVICQPMVGLSFMLFTAGFFSSVGYAISKFMDSEEVSGLQKVPFGKIAITCWILLLIGNFIPSQKSAYLMLGAYGVQGVAETVGKSKEVQEIGKSTLKLVNSAIEKYQKELEGQTEKQVDEARK